MKLLMRPDFLRYASAAVLTLLLLVSATACKNGKDPSDTLPEGTLPATLETVPDSDPDTDAVDSETDPSMETAPETTPTQSPTIVYPAAPLPDYAQYISAARIREVLSTGRTYAFTCDAALGYKNGELVACDEALLTCTDGELRVYGEALAAFTGAELGDFSLGTPAEAAKALGMEVAVYDKKTILFYEGALPLHTYEDLYTYEAMFLYMTDAGEEELLNAFIDLPDRISNNTSNTVYYTASDLNLGVQTSVYYAQMGQPNGLSVGPAIVAGEGKHANNATVVRIFNEQQVSVTQFLAFSPAVKGGVQVVAGHVGTTAGGEDLIATAPYTAAYDGMEGDVRVYDAFGLIRTVIGVRDTIPGPHTILAGRFSPDTTDDVLLVASQTTDAEGKLPYALVSLSDGSVLATHTLDCAFALGETGAGAPVSLSLRNGADADSVILHFPTVQAVYEGAPATASFENAGITLPADATAVSASGVEGERYIVSLPAREGSEDQSFVVIYAADETDGQTVDVGFRENRFFSAFYTDGYNDDKYVSRGNFQHIRTDLSNSVLSALANCNTADAVDALFDQALYQDYTFGSISQYVNALKGEYMFLEPCFTHRWNQIPHTKNLASYVDPVTGTQKYVATGKSGEYIDYEEIGSSYYNGTYADGILELAKWRIFPLRSFLQGTAPAFRGEGADPEHLVGMSPVHEHEINVPDSVGDYNPAMVEGFRYYMLDRYGSVENINRLFGTEFADVAAIDPPRQLHRGRWDAYAGDYFTEWAMYNRTIISKRIMEAYREALLAGYPPESISAHQIPEGEAVSGFLGQADTRLTPIDTVLTCGTAYGGTRYGFILRSPNFIQNANNMGHWNVTLGEYCSMQTSTGAAYKQLEYFWERGLRMVHQLTFNDEQAAAEEAAIRKLMEKNQPRPGYTGGTSGTLTVTRDGKTYNIVQIGAGADSDSAGLLKSIDAAGKWEGTVYLVPFHTHMQASDVSLLQSEPTADTVRYTTGELPTIKNADQLELTFAAGYAGEGRAYATVEVYHNGCRLENATTTYTLTDTLSPYRFVLSNQLYEAGLEVAVTFGVEGGSASAITVEKLSATLQTEKAAFTYYNGSEAEEYSEAHKGGVSFAVLGE